MAMKKKVTDSNLVSQVVHTTCFQRAFCSNSTSTAQPRGLSIVGPLPILSSARDIKSRTQRCNTSLTTVEVVLLWPCLLTSGGILAQITQEEGVSKSPQLEHTIVE